MPSRLDQVTGVSDAARDLAFANIKKAAKHYGVDLSEKEWSGLGPYAEHGPHVCRPKEICEEGGGHARERQ